MSKWIVDAADKGTALLAYCKGRLGGECSQKQVKAAINRGACSLNGRLERFAATRVAPGDTVQFDEKYLQSPSFEHRFTVESILLEEARFLAYDKPAGIDTLALLKELQRHCSGLKAVHRLDKDTSGVILFAKDDESKAWLEELFRKRMVRKVYLAIVDGEPAVPGGVIKNYLGKVGSYHGQVVWGEVPKAGGHYAETAWECLRKLNGISLIRCMPKTGRTHQIRVHLSGMGHPVLGDYQYGKAFKTAYRPLRQLLHASELCFNDQFREIVIQAPMPEIFSNLIRDTKK